MAEYDLVCDACGAACQPDGAVVSWRSDAAGERDFALTHAGHVPDGATDRIEVSRLLGPNEYLRFVSDRLGRAIANPDPLRAIIWALAPFVLRHDSPAEMDTMRAASFGERPGVKPGTRGGGPVPAAREQEAGK